MSESSASPELARARRVLASGRKLLSQVWSALKARTSKDGRISSSKPRSAPTAVLRRSGVHSRGLWCWFHARLWAERPQIAE
jgi:hypothetical protein